MKPLNKRAEGKIYEDLAAKYLMGLGYKLLAQNYHASVHGEIDLIAASPCAQILVFVEVKARKSLEAALDSLSVKKKRCLVLSAEYFIQQQAELAGSFPHSRFDLLAVIKGRKLETPVFEHLLGVDLLV